MAFSMSQYIYKNHDDTIRINIHDVHHEDGRAKEWNADVWTLHEDGSSTVVTYAEEAGDLFRTRRQAKEEYTELYGPLKSICPKDTVLDGWPDASLRLKGNEND